MKHLLIALLMMATQAYAQEEKKISHGDMVTDKLCSKEVRSLGCGNPEMKDEFDSCVSDRIEKLSSHCQAFHLDEVNRRSAL